MCRLGTCLCEGTCKGRFMCRPVRLCGNQKAAASCVFIKISLPHFFKTEFLTGHQDQGSSCLWFSHAGMMNNWSDFYMDFDLNLLSNSGNILLTGLTAQHKTWHIWKPDPLTLQCLVYFQPLKPYCHCLYDLYKTHFISLEF